QICAADPSVVDFCTETHRLEIRTERGEVMYRPDLILLTSFGEIKVIEIEKGGEEAHRESAYGAKLEHARAIYESEGWSFEIWKSAEIQQEPRLSNARAIGWDRSTAVSAADRITLSRAIQDGGGV